MSAHPAADERHHRPDHAAWQFAQPGCIDPALSRVITSFHQHARENCWDSLAGELLQHHAPHLSDQGPPQCHGCDRRSPQARRPDWPCSTYTVIAAAVLNLPGRADVRAAQAEQINALVKARHVASGRE